MKPEHTVTKSRKMPFAAEANNGKGGFDLAAVKAAIPDVIESFESGEYALLDMREVALNDGSELFIVHRRRA